MLRNVGDVESGEDSHGFSDIVYGQDIQEPLSILTLVTCSVVLRMVHIYFPPLFVSRRGFYFPRFQQWLPRMGAQKVIINNNRDIPGFGSVFVFLFPKHKCLTNLHVYTCSICHCDKCVSYYHTQRKGHCLLLAQPSSHSENSNHTNILSHRSCHHF